MEIFQKGWYLLYTKPRQEKKLHSRLTEMDIRSFLPMRKRLRSLRKRRHYVDEPLFPSYLFIYLNDLQNYYTCMDTDGALFYVRVGKKIAKVSDSVIDNVRLLVDRVTDMEVSDHHFLKGRQMVISKGPLTGLCCEVIQVNNMRKLLVRVDMLSRNVLVNLSTDYLLEV
ncbi:MAG: UpxY family transcription antiterminator [Chitinophagaceae bacterium]